MFHIIFVMIRPVVLSIAAPFPHLLLNLCFTVDMRLAGVISSRPVRLLNELRHLVSKMRA